MHAKHSDQRDTTISRRTFFRAGLAAAAGLLTARFAGQGQRAALAFDTCHWETQMGPVCQGGRLMRLRCYVCCQPCETVYCAWQDLGPC